MEHQDITEYLRSRRDRGLQTSTLYRELESLRAFHRYLFAEGFSPRDSAAKTASPKLNRRLPSSLSVGQVQRLLASLPEKNERDVRYKAMLELLYATGMRVSEIVNLGLHQLDLDSGFVRVLGKGKKERIVPLGSSAKAAVQKYLALRSRKFAGRLRETQAVFLSKFGKRLGRNEFWRQVKALAKKSGLQSSVYPHLFRHSFASHLLQGGADLRSVQELLGHASLTTTQIYTHLDTRQIKESHRRFHPRG